MPDPAVADASAGALRLRLYERALDRAGIRVLAKGRVRQPGVRLEAAVIGSSHLIEVSAGGMVFTELLACRPAPAAVPDAEVAPGPGRVERVLANGGRYRFDGRTVAWPQPRLDLDRLRDRIRGSQSDPGAVGLAYRFPGSAGGVDYAAETLVFAAARSRGVVARTAHCYPAEGLVVLSSSEITFLADRSAGKGHSGGLVSDV